MHLLYNIAVGQTFRSVRWAARDKPEGLSLQRGVRRQARGVRRDIRVKYGKEEIEKAELERWENPYQDRDYVIDISFPEFSCLCPRSGYPDYATIKISYVPDKYIVELRSLKLYLNRFRDQHISHESATNNTYV